MTQDKKTSRRNPLCASDSAIRLAALRVPFFCLCIFRHLGGNCFSSRSRAGRLCLRHLRYSNLILIFTSCVTCVTGVKYFYENKSKNLFRRLSPSTKYKPFTNRGSGRGSCRQWCRRACWLPGWRRSSRYKKLAPVINSPHFYSPCKPSIPHKSPHPAGISRRVSSRFLCRRHKHTNSRALSSPLNCRLSGLRVCCFLFARLWLFGRGS